MCGSKLEPKPYSSIILTSDRTSRVWDLTVGCTRTYVIPHTSSNDRTDLPLVFIAPKRQFFLELDAATR
jgi:hypothetical protein